MSGYGVRTRVSRAAGDADAAAARAGRPAPVLATVAVIGLCLVVPLLVSTTGPVGDPVAEIVVLATLVLAGLRFAWILGTGDRHVHEMVVWLFVYTFLGVAPLLQFRIKFPGTTPGVVLGYSSVAAWIVLVGCLALIVGSWLASRAGGQRRHRAGGLVQVSRRNVYLWALVAMSLALVYIARVGPSNLFAARTDLKASQADGLGTDPIALLMSAGARMGLVVAFVALMHLRAQRRAAGGSGPVIAPVVVLATLLAVVNPISSARYTFGTAALSVLAALGAYATVKRFRFVSVSALVGVVAVFPVLDTFRRTLDTTVELGAPIESMTTGDFDSFAQIMNTVEMVQARGIVWGEQLLGVLLFWLPRSIWPGKPVDTGIEIAQFKGYSFQNLSAPLWAEFYVNGGWVLLVAGMVGTGFVLRRLDARAERLLRSSALPGVLACVTPFYLLILLRGSLLQAMVNLFVIVASSWFVTRPERRHRLPGVTDSS